MAKFTNKKQKLAAGFIVLHHTKAEAKMIESLKAKAAITAIPASW